MSSIRTSKFKHIYGSPTKKEESFDDIAISKNAFDTTFCDVNPKFIAIMLESCGGGSFLVLPIDKYGRQSANNPVANGHKKPVTSLKWCPHDDHIIASASDDGAVFIWEIGGIADGGKDGKIEYTCQASFYHHQRRVNLVIWHPTVQNVLLTCGQDNLIALVNLEDGEIISQHTFDKPISSASFNYDGSKIVVGLKEGTVAVLESKTMTVQSEGKFHESTIKPVQVAYLKDDRVLSTGFSKGGTRQYALLDASDLGTALCMDDIDNNNGALFIHYDYDLNVVFLVGKGDSVVRYFEYDEAEPNLHYLSRYDTQDPQRGFAFMGKRGVNVSANEITRMYKLHTKKVEVIPFHVPRKSDQFQKDLFPDTPGLTPTLTVEEWLEGKDPSPILISLEDNYGLQVPNANVGRSRSNIGKVIRGPHVQAPESSVDSQAVRELQRKVDSLKDTLQEVLQRLDTLEARMADDEEDQAN